MTQEHDPDDMPTVREALQAIRDHVKKTGTLNGAVAWGLTEAQEHAIMKMWDKHRERFVENLDTVLLMKDSEVWLQEVRFPLWPEGSPVTYTH